MYAVQNNKLAVRHAAKMEPGIASNYDISQAILDNGYIRRFLFTRGQQNKL